MRYPTLLFLFFLTSCALTPEAPEAPSWVNSVRSGEGSLRVTQGQKVFFRRIAGGPEVSRQTSCELVVMKAQEDLRKEFLTAEIPHRVEALYFDPHYRDCAVTLSIDPRGREVASTEKSPQEEAELEASRIVLERSAKAIRFALTGISVSEFERFTEEKVRFANGQGLCESYFRTETYSIHGLTQVCWTSSQVVGYCGTRTGQCWTRTPQ